MDINASTAPRSRHFTIIYAKLRSGYERAVHWVASGPDPTLSPRQIQQERERFQHAFEQQLWQVCQPYLRTNTPQHTLCERVERFLPELFVFVRIPKVPAHNNLAERSVRPLVIARKIRGEPVLLQAAKHA